MKYLYTGQNILKSGQTRKNLKKFNWKKGTPTQIVFLKRSPRVSKKTWIYLVIFDLSYFWPLFFTTFWTKSGQKKCSESGQKEIWSKNGQRGVRKWSESGQKFQKFNPKWSFSDDEKTFFLRHGQKLKFVFTEKNIVRILEPCDTSGTLHITALEYYFFIRSRRHSMPCGHVNSWKNDRSFVEVLQRENDIEK